MSMLSKEFLEEFIEIFKDNPALWNTKCEEYKNRNTRKKGWIALLNKYKEIDKNANVELARKKINGLRNSYRRELKKFKKYDRNGSGSDEEYNTSLWYFNSLDFLRDHMLLKKTNQSYEDPGEMKREQSLLGEQTEDSSNEFSEMQSKSIDQCSETFDDNFEDQKLFQPCSSKKQKISENSFQPKTLINCENSIQPSVRDETDVFAEGWAIIYRRLNADQKIFAKRIIDETLVLGQFGQLTYGSIKCLDSIVPVNSPLILHDRQHRSINHNLVMSTSSTTNDVQHFSSH